MMRSFILIICLLYCYSICAQNKPSPYEWDWTRDGIWTGVGLAGSAGGLLLIKNKEAYNEQDLMRFRAEIDDINFLDHWAAGFYSEDASKLSDIPFYLSFAAPFTLLIDGKTNAHAAQLFGIYIQSLSTTATLFTITAGLVDRPRPYAYGTNAPLNRRLRATATRSFYSGHVAATTTATFFAAKVFQDFNPDSKAVPYVWAGAITLPAAVGYFRIKAGQHFLTDVLLGYGLGALAGYYIPELHKRNRNKGLSFRTFSDFTPLGNRYDGISLSLRF